MAGTVRRFSKCTPMESPIRKAIRISQRRECCSSATVSHLRIAQKLIAVNVADMAYTSPSDAENQKESEKVKASEPTKAAPNNAITWPSE